MSIRIITSWAEDGLTPEGWTDYPSRENGEVTGTLALRFDAELMALKQDGLSLGVRRWTEARWRIQQFSAGCRAKIAELAESEAPADEQARGLSEWIVSEPDFFLARQVGYWAAVNLGGGRMTLREVLDLADRDVVELDDDPDFIPDEDDVDGEGEAGKA